MLSIINYFELNSAFGRTFLNKKPKLHKGKNYLNLGAGKTIMEGWITGDFYPNVFPNFLKLSKYKNNAGWMLDLRFPLNCNNEVWDGVYTSHTLEHLNYNEVGVLLKELNRTMKTGSWLRIVLPDLRKYIEFYHDKELHKVFKEIFSTGAEAISYLTQNFDHQSAWDFELLELFLRKSGFTNIKEANFKVGTDEYLLIDLEVRKCESFYAEAQKS